MDKLIEISQLCSRGMVRILNEEQHIADVYKSRALELHSQLENELDNESHKKVTFEEKCIFRVEESIPKQVKRELYKLVS